MSGAIVEYSSNFSSQLNGDLISAMCIAPSTFGFSYYWNNFFWGTSNGHLYLYNEGLNTVTPITVSGYTGTLNGPITSLTTDQAGTYLFMGAPDDNKLLRMKLSGFNVSGNSTINVDYNIFRFGTNTGGIVVNSQGTLYFVTANGNAISTVNNYGQGLVDVLFQNPTGTNSTLVGLSLTTDETRIYAADNYTGNIYYFDFTSGQNTLQEALAASAQSRITSLVPYTSNSILLTETLGNSPGVYLYDIVNNTNILVAGGGNNTVSEFAQNYQLINPNQIALDSQQNLYVTSLDPSGFQLFTKVSFIPLIRSTITAPVPTPQFPNCGLPAPGYCKKVVIPFNPTQYWGFSSPQRIATKRPPAVACINTVTQLCPTIPPIRVNPTPPPPVPQPVAPIYPVETPSTQATRPYSSTGFMRSLRQDQGSTWTSNLFVAPSSTGLSAISFGAQGNIYVRTPGQINIFGTSGETVAPFPLQTILTPQTNNIFPVVASSTGLAAFDSGTSVVVINQNGNTVYTSNLNQQVAGAPLFIDTQNMFVYAFGNTLTALNSTNWSVLWKQTLNGDQFKSSIVTDGISIFAGTLGGNIVSYSVPTGSFYWKYNVGPLPVTSPPFIFGNLLATYTSNKIFVINKTTNRLGGQGDSMLNLSGIGTLNAPPLLFTDYQGITWLYFVTTNRILYAAGGFLGVSGAYVDSAGGNMGGSSYFWRSGDTDVLSNITPVIDASGSVYVASPNAMYRYVTPPATPQPIANNDQAGGNYFNPTLGTGSIYTSPIVSTNNQLSFITYKGSGSNYIYTISS
jgi:hypothetical protein